VSVVQKSSLLTLQEVAADQKIKAMPTFKAYKKGEVIGELTGAVPAKLTALLESIIKA
jgi:thioredoxin-like negative regulator of GroEL